MTTATNKGKIVQIIGPVIDVRFESGFLPKILDALEAVRPDGQKVTLECEQHIGEDTVRTIAMDSTDGLRRGLEVVAMGTPIKMPVGDQIKGRLFNVVGQAIDGIGAVDNTGGYSIHREPPSQYSIPSTQFSIQPILSLYHSSPQQYRL